MATCGHLENLFFAYSPELKGQSTQNLVGSIEVTFRSKLAKIVLIGKSKMAAMVAILKIYFSLLLLDQRPIDWKLGRKHRGDL